MKRNRNQQCAMKFFQMKHEIKETHPHITEWFENASQERHIQTEIIENCFKKEGRTWKLDLDKPFFKETKQRCVSIMEAYIEL